MDSLSHLLSWLIRAIIPITVWRFGPRLWSLPAFGLYLASAWVASWILPGQAPFWAIAAAAAMMAATAIATTAEMLAGLFLLEPPVHRRAAYAMLSLIGLMGGLIVAGVHGYVGGWELLSTCRLIVHAGCGLVGAISLLYVLLEGIETSLDHRWHVSLWSGLMLLHVTVSLWPTPNDANWYGAQIAHRIGLLVLLCAWPIRPARWMGTR